MSTFDMTLYSRVWRDRRGRFASVLAGGRIRLADAAQAIARSAMDRLIYSKSETVSATGRQLWTRTRNLIEHERGIVRGEGEVALTNDMVYAHSRHELGRDGRKTDRPAHWRDEIRPELREMQLAITEASVKEVLTHA